MSNQNLGLERFKEAAEQETASIEMDPAIQARILLRIRQEEKVVPWYRTRPAAISAVACAAALVVIGISSTTGLLSFPSQTTGTPMRSGAAQVNVQKANTISLSADLQSAGGLRSMPGAAKNVQTYHEGFAAAQNAQGLWGFVDEDECWVIDPQYDEVSDVKDGKAQVRKGSHIETIPVTK